MSRGNFFFSKRGEQHEKRQVKKKKVAKEEDGESERYRRTVRERLAASVSPFVFHMDSSLSLSPSAFHSHPRTRSLCHCHARTLVLFYPSSPRLLAFSPSLYLSLSLLSSPSLLCLPSPSLNSAHFVFSFLPLSLSLIIHVL